MAEQMRSGKWLGVQVNPSTGAEKIRYFDTEEEAKEYENA